MVATTETLREAMSRVRARDAGSVVSLAASLQIVRSVNEPSIVALNRESAKIFSNVHDAIWRNVQSMTPRAVQRSQRHLRAHGVRAQSDDDQRWSRGCLTDCCSRFFFCGSSQ